jgi:hypothetical protein
MTLQAAKQLTNRMFGEKLKMTICLSQNFRRDKMPGDKKCVGQNVLGDKTSVITKRPW